MSYSLLELFYFIHSTFGCGHVLMSVQLHACTEARAEYWVLLLSLYDCLPALRRGLPLTQKFLALLRSSF